ncbi:MAG: GspE/PulE family protein [Planctomycetota bacterium]
MRMLLDELSRSGLLDAATRLRAEELLAEGRSPECAVLSADGLAPDRVLPEIARFAGSEYVDLEGFRPDAALLADLPARLLTEHKMLPLSKQGDRGRVAVATVFDTEGLDELRLRTGVDWRPVLASGDRIEALLRQALGLGADTVQSLAADRDAEATHELEADLSAGLDLSDADDSASDASIVKFVNQVLADALRRRATDVHIEPFEERMSVRYRIDGVLVDAAPPPSARRFQAAIVSRLKILAHLDIAEKRLPQDGRIKLRLAGADVDVRVSIIPMLHGESVVLRLLNRSDTVTGLESLGMHGQDLRTFQKALGMPHGIVLVTGPTGSGKTTSLYAGLACINSIDRKITTVEDPVEYHLEGVNQIQVDTKTGLTFAVGLRALLRHDPDVMLVGEIRDRETAEIAVQASLTGHLVFSTLHTNDAPGAVARLIDMGVEPFLVGSSLELVMAQRLVRLICEHCKTEIPVEDAQKMRDELGVDLPESLHVGRGCEHCVGTGYRGRQGVFEVMTLDDELRALTNQRADTGQIRAVAQRNGMRTLREDGWRLVRDGRTTLEELLRVTKDERATT